LEPAAQQIPQVQVADLLATIQFFLPLLQQRVVVAQDSEMKLLDQPTVVTEVLVVAH
jgi:hypothetical protein